MYTKISFVVVCMLALLFSCSTGAPEKYKINGITESHTPKYICGIPAGTIIDKHKSVEQREDDIALEKLESDAKVETARGWVAMWIGAACLVGAIGCAFMGYISQGWKRWGGLAAMCALSCGMCWGLVEWIEYMKWLLVIPIAALLYFLYEHREHGNEQPN